MVDFIKIFSNPEKYENPEYYDRDKIGYAVYRYYNPVLKTRMDIADKVVPDNLVISFFENRLYTLNSAGIEELNSNIDIIIETAIHYERTELVAYFLEYKKTHNLYTMPDWEL